MLAKGKIIGDLKMIHQNKVKRLVEDSLWAWEEKRRLTSKTLKILGTF